MAYEMKVEGMAELTDLLSQMESRAPTVANKALYQGAGVMSEEIKRGAKDIKTAPFKFAREGSERLPSPEEKAIVVEAGAGVAKFDQNGTESQTSVGFSNSGYAELKGKRVPVPLIANAINSGTSFMRKQPFVRRAATRGGKKAIETMVSVIETEFNDMQKT